MATTTNFRCFLLLWAGKLISSLGGGLTGFGLSVYVFQTTGSAAQMATVVLFAFLPTLLLSVPAGILADRYDRRLLMMAADGLSALGVGYILFCLVKGDASLLQLCVGTTVSSAFAALGEPAYRATVTDLLTPAEYGRAAGMVGLADNARYLLSPLFAGSLLIVSDIRLLLILDICTFLFTVATTAVVRQTGDMKKYAATGSLFDSCREGVKVITANRGLALLIVISAGITALIGTIQILSEPMILTFADSAALGFTETISALGMVFTGICLSVKGIKSDFIKRLAAALAVAGGAMVMFGLKENIYLMAVAGFLFFAALPPANACLDYLARTNIPESKQGRLWGLIGFLSRLGYVVAYAFTGLGADAIAAQTDLSVGRGAAVIVIAAGVALGIASLLLPTARSLKALERAADRHSDNERM